MFTRVFFNEPYFSLLALIKTTKIYFPPVDITQRTISHDFGYICKVIIGFDETLMNPLGNSVKKI